MKMLKALVALILVVVVGGFIYLSIADANVEQMTVTKNIPVSTAQ